MDFNYMMTLNFIHFPVELLICEVPFLIHKPRKEHFALKVFVSLIIYFILSGLWMVFIEKVKGDYLFPYVFLYIGYAVLTAVPILISFELQFLELLFAIAGAYATQHMCFSFLRIMLYITRHSLDVEGVFRFFTQYIVYSIWAFLTYFVIIRKNSEKNGFCTEDIRIAFFAVLLVVSAIGFSVYYTYPENPAFLNKYTCVLCPAYGFLCCALVLTMEYYVLRENHMKKEHEIMEQLLQMANSQQKYSKEAIDIINIKCHDLKHQLKALEEMPDSNVRSEYAKEIRQTVSIYDAIFHTGCEALDYVLREKCLISNEHNVAFSCMADGRLINFMKPADIYALMGNALDNALECVINEEEEKRTISLHIKQSSDMVLIHMENRCSIVPEFHNGLPVTNKKDRDYHGFGVRSIRYVAEKYNGELYMNVKDEMFIMNVLLPRKHTI